MATLPLIAPMLATPGRLPPAAADEQWAYEVKQDGQRAMAYLPGDGSIRLLARSGAVITPAYPDLVALGPALGGVPAVLDGEIVALDEQGRSDFERLQSRMGLSGSPAKAARAAQRVPAHLVLFDVVFLGDRSLVRLPWTERRAALEGLGLDGPHWSTPAVVVGHGEQALAMTREAGLGVRTGGPRAYLDQDPPCPHGGRDRRRLGARPGPAGRPAGGAAGRRTAPGRPALRGQRGHRVERRGEGQARRTAPGRRRRRLSVRRHTP